MKLSTDRILTTHVGSLPRPQALSDLLLRRETGEAYDRAEFDDTLSAALDEVVARQASIGIDVVSDGEYGKISYSTYINDRLNGFEGESPRKMPLDLQLSPGLLENTNALHGRQLFKRRVCVGPIAIKDREPLQKDLANFASALSKTEVVEAFMNAASPGVVSAFQPNEFYPSHAAYIGAIGEAMREEYEAIVGAGFILQLDCPDLAMARHTGFQDLSEEEFLDRAETQVEVLNDALADIPAQMMRMHICWGNYEGPHVHDIALEKVIGIILKAKPQAISFEAANPRHEHEWEVWRDAGLPENKVLIPGVLDSTTNFVEHPKLVAQRICRFADIVGRERVIAGSDCGFATFAGSGKVDPEVAFLKLAALVEGAAIASDQLWG